VIVLVDRSLEILEPGYEFFYTNEAIHKLSVKYPSISFTNMYELRQFRFLARGGIIE